MALLAAGTVPWVKSWTNGAAVEALSLATGKAYRGVNRWLLNPHVHGYGSPLWGTFKQIQGRGWNVLKGQKSMPAVFWRFLERKNSTTGRVDQVPLLRYYSVFNLDQTDAPDDARRLPVPPSGGNHTEPDAVLANYFRRENIKAIHGGNIAAYAPSTDLVMMPHSEAFTTADDYMQTLAHEAVHSTGHPSRLNRPLCPLVMSRTSYSTEELIAEVGACMVMQACGRNPAYDNSAGYIAGWLKALGNDTRMVIRAASKAEAASEYILKGPQWGATTVEEATEEVASEEV
jgi:antirestriction protein ArdC